ncbi:FMRFamide receptor [Biomphalaria pfeifferi]|uniref:FMRFamide receptor n=1 Tax=Biomphalaria pfeifferi TaxID=112525 RepID=A0AAD8B4G3_BIOPF|nr:FMRFamide receptor [Biomphalaria pfeifferi]
MLRAFLLLCFGALAHAACQGEADVLLILDSSGSIGKANYDLLAKFSADLTSNFTVAPDAIQFGTIIFSDSVQNIFNFNQFTNNSQVAQALLKIPYLSQSTHTAQALDYARTNSFTAAQGARPNAGKIAVVITDGNSQNAAETAAAAARLKQSGVTVIAVGVGSSISQTELKAIASGDSNVFNVNNYSVLDAIRAGLVTQACEAATTQAPTPTVLKECDRDADILLILDSSTSIGRPNYASLANFAADLTSNFKIGPSQIQFSALLFSNTVHNLFDFNRYHTNAEIQQALIHMPYLSGSTHTAAALDYARTNSFTAAHGSRTNVAKIAIVITDGNSQNHFETAQAAERLKNSGVKVIAVGVGGSISNNELLAIASTPADIFNVNDYSVLDDIKGELFVSACNDAVTLAATIPVETDEGTAHCEGEADILLILDSSTSIGRSNYGTLANFAAGLTRNFHIGPDAIQFGAVLFSDNIRNLFDLNHFHTNDEISQALIHMPYLTGSTHTSLALDYAHNTAFTTQHGARNNVGKIAIVITDGNSQNHAQTAQAAERLKNSGVKVIAVGVGNRISRAELLAIASDEKDIFNVNDYSVLNEIKNALVTSACEVATTTPAPTTTTTSTTTTTTRPTTTTSQIVVCESAADVLLILDSSGSIGKDNYALQANFSAELAKNFKIGPNNIQFSAIIFSTTVQELFDFQKYHTNSDIVQALLNMNYMSASTHTAEALNYARTHSFTPAAGSRPNVGKIAVVVTDGNSQDAAATATAATQLKQSGVKVIAIGVGSSISQAELQAIASTPADIFNVNDYKVLDDIRANLVNTACHSISVTQAPAA